MGVAQVLKDEVARRISRAALEAFAKRGFEAASMAEIARAAGVSTGNIYRYFASKDVLFDAVVPASLGEELVTLLERRVQSLAGIHDVRELPPSSAFHAASDDLLVFAIRRRLETVVLLGRTDASPREGFDARVVALLETLAIEHFRHLDPSLDVGPGERLVLRLAYQNLVRSMVEILETHSEEAAIRSAVTAYGRYHLAGLKHLLTASESLSF